MELESLTEYKQILVDNLEEWKNTTDLRLIELKKCTGLTNATYRAINTSPTITGPHKTVVIRIFGTVEGLVDKKKEHLIFSELGNNGQGPKCLAYGGSWRIEEFIHQGSHPDLAVMRNKTYRRLIAKYLSQFHKVELSGITREDAVIAKYVQNKTETFKPFYEKIQIKNLFTEEEKEILKEFEAIGNDKEIEYLESILPKSETVLCHNDLNNLNVFYSEKESASNRLKFIDFEYSAYNYYPFDIANFMNESHFNYTVTSDPYYAIVQENIFKIADIQDFVQHYIAARAISDSEILNQFEDEIVANPADTEVPLKYAIKYMTEESFNSQCDQLIEEILACQILSNWYWVIWSVITAKAPGMLFNHIHYGKARFEIFKNLKVQLNEFKTKKAEAQQKSSL